LQGLAVHARVADDGELARQVILLTARLYWEAQDARSGMNLLKEFGLTPDLVHGEWDLPLVTVTNDDPESYRAAGIQSLSHGRPQDAVRHLLHARALGIDDSRLANSLAEAYRLTGDLAAAVSEYQGILDRDGRVPEILVNYAVALMDMQRTPAAEAALLEALQQDRRSVRALYNLGTLYLGMGYYEKAAGYLRQCLRFDPGHGPGLFNLAVVYDQQGRRQDALERYEEFIAKHGRSGYDQLISRARLRLGELKGGRMDELDN
ncbi:tetratricopeptide repeat protein, partial [bacterium]|nr:tetratricopeptide repeat protein [candidate division CSSED10-310 bacterium]